MMPYLQTAGLIIPETIVSLTALMLLGIDLGFLKNRSPRARMNANLVLAALGLIVAMVWLCANMPGAKRIYFDGLFVTAPLVQWIKVAVLVMTLLTVCISVPERFTTHPAEYLALLLFASAGMMFLVSTEHLLMIFIALELLSLCLYVLTALDKQSPASAEAALKYFLFGGISAAVLLFGASLIYGITGELNLVAASAHIKSAPRDPLLLVACIMVAAGLGFKIAAAPFHLWVPDAYQAAPLPAAAFIASASKVASFFVLAKILLVGLTGAEGNAGWGRFCSGWIPLFAVIAALSIFVGNVAAIAQKSVRRLLAYSAVAHAGYALIGLLANQQIGVASVVFYAVTYALTVLGAFAVVGVVQARNGTDDLAAFAGLRRHAPVLSFCMMIFLLSLAGIPPLAGFFGKFYLFAAALRLGNQDLIWLVAFGIAMSAVSLYYYLQVLKQIYVAEPRADVPVLPGWAWNKAIIVVIAILVVALGLAPNLLVGPLMTAIARGF